MIGIELASQTGTFFSVLPEVVYISVLKVSYQGTHVGFFFIVIHAEVRAAVPGVGVEWIVFSVRIFTGAGNKLIVGKTQRFVSPAKDDNRSRFQVIQTIAPFFRLYGRPFFQFPACGYQCFHKLKKAPEFIEFVCPLPLKQVHRRYKHAVFRMLQMLVETVERAVSWIHKELHWNVFRHGRRCLPEPCGFGYRRHSRQQLTGTAKIFVQFFPPFFPPPIRELRRRRSAIFHFCYHPLQFIGKRAEAFSQFLQNSTGEAIFRHVPCDFLDLHQRAVTIFPLTRYADAGRQHGFPGLAG